MKISGQGRGTKFISFFYIYIYKSAISYTALFILSLPQNIENAARLFLNKVLLNV